MRAIAALVAIAACGNGDAVGDAAADGTEPACMASFTGNFTETSLITACAQVEPDAVLAIVVPSTMLGTSFKIAIDLGAAPAAAAYSSETVATWSATASEPVGGPDCIYLASNTTTPRGSFALSLDHIDVASGAAHGTLEVTMYVLTPPFTSCGSQMTEMLALRF